MAGSLRKLINKRKRKCRSVRERNRQLDELDKLNNEYNYRKQYLPLWSFYRKVLRDIIRPEISIFKKEYIANNRKNGKIPCQSSGIYYYPRDTECDHYKPKFRELAKRFAYENNLDVNWNMFVKAGVIQEETKPSQQLDVQSPDSPFYAEFIKSIPIHDKKKDTKPIRQNLELKNKLLLSQASVDNSNIYLAKFVDTTLNQKWIDYHNAHAVLRIISKELNQRLH